MILFHRIRIQFLHEAKTTWKSIVKQKSAKVTIKNCSTVDAPSLCRVPAQISFFDLSGTVSYFFNTFYFSTL
jgi:hypothetical protein